MSVAQRRYFVDVRANPELGIGLPLKSRVNLHWVIPVARQLRNSGGAFAGVIYVNVELDEIHETLQGLKLGASGIASIINWRNEVVAHSLADTPITDEVSLQSAAPQTREAIGNGRELKTYESISSVDEVERLVMYRKVAPYPLYVVVGLERSNCFAAWYTEAFSCTSRSRDAGDTDTPRSLTSLTASRLNR